MIKNNFGFEALRVTLKALHQIRPLHAIGIGRPVIHIGGGHELATLGETGDDHRFQICTCCINRGAITCGAGAENE